MLWRRVWRRTVVVCQTVFLQFFVFFLFEVNGSTTERTALAGLIVNRYWAELNFGVRWRWHRLVGLTFWKLNNRRGHKVLDLLVCVWEENTSETHQQWATTGRTPPLIQTLAPVSPPLAPQAFQLRVHRDPRGIFVRVFQCVCVCLQHWEFCFRSAGQLVGQD